MGPQLPGHQKPKLKLKPKPKPKPKLKLKRKRKQKQKLKLKLRATDASKLAPSTLDEASFVSEAEAKGY
jgi:hypothetical protein